MTTSTDSRVVPRATRFGGWLIAIIGVANLAFGLLSLLTDAVRLGPGTAGALVVLGVASIALGVLVRRGSGAALTVSLTIFGSLLVLQFPDIMDAGDHRAGSIGRVVLLSLVVVALAIGKRAEVTARRSRTEPS